MGKINVKNGTPVGCVHLCKSCKWGQYTSGYRESDFLVICANSTPSRLIPFVVHECTDFEDRNRPDWEQMEKLAISFHKETQRRPVHGFRGSGFAQSPIEEDPDDVGEVEEVARG